MSLADKQLSALFSLVKNVHNDAVAKRLPIDKSFDCFKQVLLRHSVHRSVAITVPSELLLLVMHHLKRHVQAAV